MTPSDDGVTSFVPNCSGFSREFLQKLVFWMKEADDNEKLFNVQFSSGTLYFCHISFVNPKCYVNYFMIDFTNQMGYN
jgi:hypothetical protein